MNAIQIWNRKKGLLEPELVYGDRWLRFAYGSFLGRWLVSFIVHPWFSRFFGFIQSDSSSSSKISSFIEQFKIDMSEFEDTPFSSFNDFFIRKFKPGKRTFPTDQLTLGAFAEGRYLVFPTVTGTFKVPVKGFSISLVELLGKEVGTSFEGGFCIIARLCPVDYHRFHFPDSGKYVKHFFRHGPLHSVNPLALQAKPDILFTNERQISILETETFGELAYVEVGALCVGKIVQSHTQSEFQRGQEKGYFLFGGSTVILVGKPGEVEFDQDLIQRSKDGIESLLQLGDSLGRKI